jgi:hypothetical protein
VVICGHHPITGIKAKDSKLKTIAASESFIHFLFEIKKMFEQNPKYFYLCADLHCYQQGNITLTKTVDNVLNMNMEIEQHIAGTGGADLDVFDIPQDYSMPTLIIPRSPYTVEYTLMSSVTRAENGYLKCVEQAGDGFTIDFVSTFKTTGGRTRRKKRRIRKN